MHVQDKNSAEKQQSYTCSIIRNTMKRKDTLVIKEIWIIIRNKNNNIIRNQVYHYDKEAYL